MITTLLDNSNPFTLGTGLATKVASISIPEQIDIPEIDFCYCDLECGYVEKVFGSATSDWWKNDRSAFLFRKETAGDSITLKLFKKPFSRSTSN